MSRSLAFWAGKTAYAKIKSSGLRPDDINVMAGAAGGPKWLVLNHLDRTLFSSWLNSREKPLFLLGSSIGAWRFATICHKDPLAALDRFEEAYMEQTYGASPSSADIGREIGKILERLMKPDGSSEILSHPLFRLNIMAVRCKGPTASDSRGKLLPGLALAAMGNAVSRKFLKYFFERILFYDSREEPPFFNMNEFPIRRIPLDTRNIKPALMASGSIPLLMPGEKDIPEAPPGMYRDGGIIDYHLNIDLAENKDDIVLFPHYTERIIPGWLDKQIPWRKPELSRMDNVLMIAPTKTFTNRLPYGKIPDRTDFKTFFGRDGERKAYWHKVIDMSRELADEFMEAVETNRIESLVRPISEFV